MKSRTLTSITVMTLFATLAIPVGLSGQRQDDKPKHHHYKLIDIGTFGGPSSTFNNFYAGPFFDSGQVLNKRGTLAGWADTSIPDPFPSRCLNADCFVSHGFQWRDGILTSLGSLANGWSSQVTWINDTEEVVGLSQNGLIDPLIGFPEQRAVLWRDGQITDLSTFGGNQSVAFAVNNHGQIAGLALNTVPDPFSIYDFLYFGSVNGTQTRAVLWDKDGSMQDLGTLGTGPDAYALLVNERGQVTGWSYTNSTPNPTTGLPTFHPFLWEKEKGMEDLGTLGGTVAQAVNGLNERGQVVGSTTLLGDVTFHPFLWDGKQLRDLGTFGGNNGEAIWLNNATEVVGSAQYTMSCSNGLGGIHAFLWRDGVLNDLGTINNLPFSEADFINDSTQVVGNSFNCDFSSLDAFLWEQGSIVDLNRLLSQKSPIHLAVGSYINNRGEIAALGVLPDGDGRAVLLMPCDENHPGVEGCDYTLADGSAMVDVAHAHATNISSPLINSPATTVGQLNRLRGGMLAGAHKRLAPDFHNSRAALSSAPHNLIASALNSYQIRINWQEASGQNQGGFNIYRCHGCPSPRAEGTRIASVGASVLSYTNGSSTSPLTETTTYTYQVTAFNSNGESGPSNASSAPTKTEPAPTNLSSFAFSRGVDDIVDLRWTNNSTDDNSYYVESCTGSTCTNFSTIAQLGANATTDTRYFEFAPDVTLRYRVRAHSPGGYSGYSNIRNQVLP